MQNSNGPTHNAAGSQNSYARAPLLALARTLARAQFLADHPDLAERLTEHANEQTSSDLRALLNR